MTDDGKERISPHGYSVTDDEKLYLRQLCDGPKDAHEIADELAADPAVSKAHSPATVADRLADLEQYGGTEHLLDCDGRSNPVLVISDNKYEIGRRFTKEGHKFSVTTIPHNQIK